MSVPTTLQGTHDGCGELVVFRPATHRRELLAGAAVVLRAACRGCGATLATEYVLPGAGSPALAPEANSAAEVRERDALPVAAGAEAWEHAIQGGPRELRSSERPAAELGTWRMRADHGPAGHVDTTFDETEAHSPLASAPEPAPQDPQLDAYMSAFARRVASARANLDLCEHRSPGSSRRWRR